MLGKLKKHKKLLIVILVLLIVAGGVSAFFLLRGKKKSNATEFEYIRTVKLSKSSLMDTVIATGVIESQSTSTITSNVNDTTVSKINYQVGDYVKEGDVIIELDTTSIYKQINKQKEKVTEQEESLQDRYDDALEDYDDAEKDYKNLQARESTASADLNTKKSAMDAAKKDMDDNPGVQEKANAYNTAKAAYEEAQKTLSSISSELSQAKTKYKQAESTFEEAEKNLNSGADTDNLDDLYDKAANYKLKAKTSGQITSINAVLGDSTNGTLATIQDTSKLKISLTIDEYDILKLSLGMKAYIETDASDITYEGEISQISPVASTSMGSSGGFGIEVVVTSEDVSNLLIGMNAEVTIVISTSAENYNVPIDAVGEKADGTKVIYVQNESGEFEELEVETGQENGYYVEIISDELYDGMTVRASANEDEAKVKITEDEMSEASEGFGFGNMPGSGGFDMPSGGDFNPGAGGGFSMPSGGPSGGFGGR